MSVRKALALIALAAAPACSKPPATGTGGSVKSLSDVTDTANGVQTVLRQCQGKYRAFAGIRPDESAFVNFSDAERTAFNTSATAVPGFALYLFAMVLDGQFEIDDTLSECKGASGKAAQGPCAIFRTEAGDYGQYKVVFEKGAEKIASHLPFAAGLAMINMARYEVKDGKPVYTDLPAAVKADLEEVKGLFLAEAKFDLSKAGTAAEVASLKSMPLEFFAAHALDSTLCNDDLVRKDTAAYPKTMAKMADVTKGFAAVETAFAAALAAGTPLAIPAGLAPLAQRLAENLKAGAALAHPGKAEGLGLWGKGGIGGGGKVAVGEGPMGRAIFENPTRAAGEGVLNSKGGRWGGGEE